MRLIQQQLAPDKDQKFESRDMEENNKRTAAEQIAESDAAGAQPQPATAQDGTTARTAPAVVGNEATTTKPQTVVTVSKMSPQEQQYLKAELNMFRGVPE